MSDLTARAVNAAADAAQEEVLRFALRFKRREEYRPLEELARRVQRVAVVAAIEVVKEETAEEAER
jgi:hypothetical protein